jgi:hypothetical protein
MSIYPALEELLAKVSTMKDDDTKNGNILKIYDWYRSELGKFNYLNKIDTITKKPYYDKSPDITNKLANKSVFWECANYPLQFEVKHRTQDESSLIPPKEKLKNYVTHKILDPSKVAEINEDFDKEKDSKRMIQTSHSAFRSTHYTNFNSTQSSGFSKTNFSQGQNKSTVNQSNREVKSLYMTLRPKYNFENLCLENQVNQKKYKELATKRFESEKHTHLKEYGLEKSKQIEEKERIRQIKIILNNINNQKILSKTKEKIVESPNTITNNSMIEELDLSTLKNKNENIENSDTLKEKRITINGNFSKNISKNNLENFVEKIQERIDNVEMTNFPSEMFGKSLFHPILSKRLFNRDKGINQINLAKSGYALHYRPMSLYDFTNKETEKLSSIKESKKPSYNHRPSTSIDFLNLDPENNPLNRRRLLSGSKQFEIDKIKSSLIEKNMRKETQEIAN